MPAVAALPALTQGYVTFASPNSMFKLSTQTVALWSRLLRLLPEARLAMATVPQSEARRRIIAEFERHGVDPARIAFEQTTGRRAFWDWLNRVDIALDSFPCNGGATTSETLWMGVPVVSRAGDAFLSRAGLSLLQITGRPEWIADSDEAFIDIATRLARDLPALAQERSRMRERLSGTRLLDARAFIQELESHYRAMWRAWCERSPGGSR
jgi:predicted O-linked N-acetylglucosamine transferase (SPINDLY family)